MLQQNRVQHILVAHDLSPDADLALQRAARLARETGARISLLYVLDERDAESDEQQARTLLQQRLQQNALSGSEPWIRRGQPVEEILTQAAGLEADLLILGRHHKRSGQGFAGTTLERIMLESPAPMLLAITPDAPYQRAMAALDFSRCATRAMQYAWALLGDGAELHALHVHEMAEVHGPDHEGLALQQELFDQLIEDIRQQLPDTGALLSYSLYQGERSNCMEAALRDLQPQLLALGSHSRGEMSSALLGSLARQFLDNPPCDLLIAR
ncbi:universal stress protein [Pseudomonas stutzeri]|uniref:Universal stress protein n=1 Tax=Stutzerimonas stutzeri TaxID=316 RepID=A0A2N8RYE7_STUST|nr:universal stress protein [Stutzerimonas stutzeri]MCQ4296026.1 universal stress protein [Stutzerimonas stutzeri]PNF79376.1 universal stress protein [Stutzerimonas stutzeri]